MYPFLTANPYNWKIPEDEIADVCNVSSDSGTPEDWGTGGFVPFGFEGVMQGAATCFFGFVGFDVIATTGESKTNLLSPPLASNLLAYPWHLLLLSI